MKLVSISMILYLYEKMKTAFATKEELISGFGSKSYNGHVHSWNSVSENQQNLLLS